MEEIKIQKRKLQIYLDKYQKTPNLSKITSEKLNDLLCQFFACEDFDVGLSHLRHSSYQQVYHQIAAKFKPHQITKSPKFVKLRDLINTISTKKLELYGNLKDREAIPAEIVIEIIQSLNLLDPTELMYAVYFILGIGFCLRRSENANLTWNHIQFVKRDGNNMIKLLLKRDKSHKGKLGQNRIDPSYITELPDNPRCPYKIVKEFYEHRNPQAEESRIYTYPITRKNFDPKKSKIWYTKRQIGINVTGNWTKKICEEFGGLSVGEGEEQMNIKSHSLRITGTTLLAENDVADFHIMHRTRHSNPSVVQRYKRTSVAANTEQTQILFGGKKLKNENESGGSVETAQKILKDNTFTNCNITFNFN